MIRYTTFARNGSIAGSAAHVAEADLVLSLKHGAIEVLQSRLAPINILVVQEDEEPDSADSISPRTVICQKWEESEQGWGVRPDGYSLHPSLEASERYIKEYWDCMPDGVPSKYFRPSGLPYECKVDEETYMAVCASPAGGTRFYDNQYPAGDTDGWMVSKGPLGNG